MASANSGEVGPPHKRRKTQLACTPCRARKTGCDGRRPYCTSCISRGWQDRCAYQDKVSASPALALLDLEKRLQRLEGGDSAPPGGRVAQSEDPPATFDNENLAGTVLVASEPSDYHDHDSLSGVILPSRAAANQATQDAGGHSSFSNYAFVQDVTSVAAGSVDSAQEFLRDLGGSAKEISLPSYLGLPLSQTAAIRYDLRDMVLPPRSLADSLIQHYWEFIYPISPVIHKPSFLAEYNKIWSPAAPNHAGPTSQDAVFYAILNMVMALGCQRNETSDAVSREDLGMEFYKRSQKLVSTETLDRYSLPIAQLLVLRSMWLLYGPFPERCWTMTGVAVRVSQAIGLDNPKLNAQRTSQLIREMRRRVWYSCVMLDRIVSNTFGRTKLLPDQTDVPMLAEIDDKYLHAEAVNSVGLVGIKRPKQEGQQPPNIPSRLTCFVLSIEIFKITDKAQALQAEYAKSGRHRYSYVELSTVLDIYQALDTFEAELPPHLRIDSNKSGSEDNSQPYFQLQRRMLKARMNYVRLWMLRPFLLNEVVRIASSTTSAQDGHSGGMKNRHHRLVEEVCLMCIKAAHDVLLEIQDAFSGPFRTSPWHALFFTFGAASILIAAQLYQELGVSLETGEGKASWDIAMKIFEFHSGHLPHAEKAVEMLEKFRKFIKKKAKLYAAAEQAQTSSSLSPIGGAGTTPATENISGESTLMGDETSPENMDFEWNFDVDPTSLDLSWFTSQDLQFDDWFTTLSS